MEFEINQKIKKLAEKISEYEDGKPYFVGDELDPYHFYNIYRAFGRHAVYSKIVDRGGSYDEGSLVQQLNANVKAYNASLRVLKRYSIIESDELTSKFRYNGGDNEMFEKKTFDLIQNDVNIMISLLMNMSCTNYVLKNGLQNFVEYYKKDSKFYEIYFSNKTYVFDTDNYSELGKNLDFLVRVADTDKIGKLCERMKEAMVSRKRDKPTSTPTPDETPPKSPSKRRRVVVEEPVLDDGDDSDSDYEESIPEAKYLYGMQKSVLKIDVDEGPENYGFPSRPTVLSKDIDVDDSLYEETVIHPPKDGAKLKPNYIKIVTVYSNEGDEKDGLRPWVKRTEFEYENKKNVFKSIVTIKKGKPFIDVKVNQTARNLLSRSQVYLPQELC